LRRVASSEICGLLSRKRVKDLKEAPMGLKTTPDILLGKSM
jgi:hypothetical protein